VVQVHLGPPSIPGPGAEHAFGDVREGRGRMRRMMLLAAAALAAATIARRRRVDDEDLWTEATQAPDLR
jgi:hypothetical protein